MLKMVEKRRWGMLVMLLMLVGSMLADNLTVSNVTLQAGGTGALTINLNNSGKQYVAFQFDMVLPNGISIAKNAKGKLMVKLNADRIDDHTLSVNDLGSGTYRLVCVSMSNTELYGTKGALVNVTLQANGNVGTGIKSAQITEQVFTDKDRNPVTFNNLMFFITVKNSSTILKGDVNGDGVITAQDALLILQMIPTKMSSTADDIIYQIADVNGDGNVSAQDASLILQHLTGKVNW